MAIILVCLGSTEVASSNVARSILESEKGQPAGTCPNDGQGTWLPAGLASVPPDDETRSRGSCIRRYDLYLFNAP